jgi:hypothetical protein
MTAPGSLWFVQQQEMPGTGQDVRSAVGDPVRNRRVDRRSFLLIEITSV